jgi:hypothetical protein
MDTQIGTIWPGQAGGSRSFEDAARSQAEARHHVVPCRRRTARPEEVICASLPARPGWPFSRADRRSEIVRTDNNVPLVTLRVREER